MYACEIMDNQQSHVFNFHQGKSLKNHNLISMRRRFSIRFVSTIIIETNSQQFAAQRRQKRKRLHLKSTKLAHVDSNCQLRILTFFFFQSKEMSQILICSSSRKTGQFTYLMNPWYWNKRSHAHDYYFALFFSLFLT